jgi:5-methylcytosine-specific restriction endonuclease McrA
LLFTYCTQVLHLAEGSAYNRIEVARSARKFPRILDLLEQGAVTLTAVRLLCPHLTADNHKGVLAAARYKSKRDVEILVATLAPRPAAPALLRKLPAQRSDSGHVQGPLSSATPDRPASEADITLRCGPQPTLAERGNEVTPLAPERYKIQFTIARETRVKLARVQDLLRHRVPNGDLAAVFDRALTTLLDSLERQRYAATARPLEVRLLKPGSRQVPAAVRRFVWERDEGHCAFVGPNGRCTERGFIEFHHVHPYALGGPATAENIQLRCRAHNQFEASLAFGPLPGCVREARHSWIGFPG